jgi:hypothetical protein
MYMKNKKSLRVLHLPANIGGNAFGLSRGERKLGLISDVLIKYPTPYKFQYPCDIDLKLSEKNFFERFFTITKSFLKARKKYDIFHFDFGSTFFGSTLNSTKLGFLDLPFYPKKSKLFVTFNGCEAKQKFAMMKRTKICPCLDGNCHAGVCNNIKVDEYKQKSINILAKYVKHMWALNPDILYYLPLEKSSFLPYTVYPSDPKISFPKFNKKLKIIHAPSSRIAKGTKYIIKAIKDLEKKYPALIDFCLIENIPHEQAIDLYSTADLVIDQLLFGWYGAFAVEVMLMGKPVIARIEKDDLHFISQNMTKDLLETIIDADPYNIYDVLEKCINDREFLKQRSTASLNFAKKWHDPIYVASLVKEKYEEN